MRRRRHPEALIHRVVFENPVTFLSQSPKFVLPAGVSDDDAVPAPAGLTGRGVRLELTHISRVTGLDHGLHLTYCTNIHPGRRLAGGRREHQAATRPRSKAGSRPRDRSASACGCPRAKRASCSPANDLDEFHAYLQSTRASTSR